MTAKFVTCVPARIPVRMEQNDVSKYLSEIGRRGAHARAKRLTPEQRKEIARKAGKASGKVRKKKAEAKRKGK